MDNLRLVDEETIHVKAREASQNIDFEMSEFKGLIRPYKTYWKNS